MQLFHIITLENACGFRVYANVQPVTCNYRSAREAAFVSASTPVNWPHGHALPLAVTRARVPGSDVADTAAFLPTLILSNRSTFAIPPEGSLSHCLTTITRLCRLLMNNSCDRGN